MAHKIQAVKGMNDLLPVTQKDQPISSSLWQAFENIAQEWLASYDYRQIRTPIIEPTALFVRSIGEETDVVGKEMYTFDDYGQSLSLRPEGTASCLRAVVEHNLLYNAPQKLWYMGAMFRHEKPQKGRYRQFHQIGVEALGFVAPEADVEIIAMCADLFKRLGIYQELSLEINCLGNREERNAHRTALVAYLESHRAILDEDSLRRMHTNPLRVLDSKNPLLQEMANSAPRLLDFLQEESLMHYNRVKTLLNVLEIPFVENPRLVRGLDYYNSTVFEWTTTHLGAQGTVCGGGRYDGLIEELGGKNAPSIGFAIGIERLLLLVLEKGNLQEISPAQVYAIYQGQNAATLTMKAVQQLRQAGFTVFSALSDQKIATQMKKADASGARFALIVGDDEFEKNNITLKDLRGNLGQITVPMTAMIDQLNQWKD